MTDPASSDRASRITAFNPGYTWPNEAFPFRLYLNHPKCRIFIIECFTHNWKWLSEHYRGIRGTDIFLVISGWDQSSDLFRSARKMIDALGLSPEQFFALANTQREVEVFTSVGIPAAHINNNAWIDENGQMRPLPVAKLYDAIYVARLVAFKRHHLAARVRSLALVAGSPHQKTQVQPPEHIYLNEKPLTRPEVARKINESRVGLILSAVEGGCYASSEYLLCGVPVVSTPSLGGRDTWYNEYNSLIVEPTQEGVAAGVEHFLRRPRDPEKIRAMHIDLAQEHRRRFVSLLGQLFARFGITDISPDTYFHESYFEKMRTSSIPNFNQLFDSGI